MFFFEKFISNLPCLIQLSHVIVVLVFPFLTTSTENFTFRLNNMKASKTKREASDVDEDP